MLRCESWLRSALPGFRKLNPGYLLIDAITDREPMQFICLDKGFKGNDQFKANAVQTFKFCSKNSETEMVFKVV